jgi:(2Fe-2S) ferredoxin
MFWARLFRIASVEQAQEVLQRHVIGGEVVEHLLMDKFHSVNERSSA